MRIVLTGQQDYILPLKFGTINCIKILQHFASIVVARFFSASELKETKINHLA